MDLTAPSIGIMSAKMVSRVFLPSFYRGLTLLIFELQISQALGIILSIIRFPFSHSHGIDISTED